MKFLFALPLGILAALVAPACFAADNNAKDPFLDDLPTVEAAALHEQTLDEAPADVTVITRAEIRTYGYRTLGEALNSVRGFYLSSDHIYSYAGVRGFSLPGDFNTRFLVMINGHPMTDNVFSSNGFFEQDFGLDMDLVERIEVVRGPSSALYGSNGIFATINIVTVSPVDLGRGYATAEADTFGGKKAMLAGSYYLGGGANLLISGSVVNSSGQSFFFPEYDSAMYGFGRATGMDGERAYHTFANLTWHGWSFTAYFNNRDKNAPLAWDDLANSFFARGSHVEDGRSFASAAYRGSVGRGDLRFQISYDQYRYRDRFDFITSDGLLDRGSYADGDWLDSQISYQVPAGWLGTFTAGADASFDLRNLQFDREISPQPLQYFEISRPSLRGALFVEDEKRLSARWKLDFGVRLDGARYYNEFVSPRVALAYQPSSKTVYKLIYGRPFRDPNAFEQFYSDGAQYVAAAPLRRETADTFELSAQHHFTSSLTGTLNAFEYKIDNVIQQVLLADGNYQFQNVASARSEGFEVELAGKPKPWLETGGSFTWQSARFEGASLPNSPRELAKFRWAFPAGRWLTAAGDVMWTSSRLTLSGIAERPVLLADLTLTLHHLPGGCDLQFGVRNALNWAYQDPVALSLDQFPGDPRSMFVKLVWNAGR